MSSDSTGEIYAILRVDGNATSITGSNATGTIPGETGTGSAPPAATTTSGADTMGVASVSGLVVVFAIFAFLF